MNTSPLAIFASNAPAAEKLQRLAQSMQGSAIELVVEHVFSEGIYARKLFIPKGTVLVGKIHKFGQLNIVSKGEISVFGEGVELRKFFAGDHIPSPAGAQRAGYAHQDTIWTTIHATMETDVAKIEAELIAQDKSAYLAFCKTIERK